TKDSSAQHDVSCSRRAHERRNRPRRSGATSVATAHRWDGLGRYGLKPRAVGQTTVGASQSSPSRVLYLRRHNLRRWTCLENQPSGNQTQDHTRRASRCESQSQLFSPHVHRCRRDPAFQARMSVAACPSKDTRANAARRTFPAHVSHHPQYEKPTGAHRCNRLLLECSASERALSGNATGNATSASVVRQYYV